MHRASLKSATRIVVKLGTGVLTDSRKLIDPAQLEQIVAQVAALSARTAAVQNQASRLAASINLINALGGGWSATDQTGPAGWPHVRHVPG